MSTLDDLRIDFDSDEANETSETHETSNSENSVSTNEEETNDESTSEKETNVPNNSPNTNSDNIELSEISSEHVEEEVNVENVNDGEVGSSNVNAPNLDTENTNDETSVPNANSQNTHDEETNDEEATSPNVDDEETTSPNPDTSNTNVETKYIMTNKEDILGFDDKLEEYEEEQLEQEADEIRKQIVERQNQKPNDDNVEHSYNELDESSSITTFDDVQDLNDIVGLQEANDVEQIMETEINGIPAQIFVDKEHKEQPTEAEMQKKIDAGLVNEIKRAKNQAAEILKNKQSFVDLSTLEVGSESYNFAQCLLFWPVYIPQENVETQARTHKYITTNSYVQTISGYNNYSDKNQIDEHMLYTISDAFVICKKVNKIFDFQFVNTKATDFKMNDIAEKAFEFLKLNANRPDLIFEHMIVVNLLGKLEIYLCTDTLTSLKGDSISVNNDYLTAFSPYIEQVESIQNPGFRLRESWNIFVKALFSLDARDKYCWNIKTQGYAELNEFLHNSYCYNREEKMVNYQMEELIGNTLKMYTTSVVMSMFFAIRTIYLTVRLVSIYIQKKLNEGKTKQQVADDFHFIAAFAILTYEQKYRIWSGMPKSPSTIRGMQEATPEFQQFIDNFVVRGGQYYILKALEKAIPILSINV